MEDTPPITVQKREMKKKMAKTVEGKKLTKEAILKRLSAGKRRYRSEPRVKKELKTPVKGDDLAKKLMFLKDGQESNERSRLVMKDEKYSTLITPGKKQKTKKVAKGTTKWQVTEVESLKKEKRHKDTKREKTPKKNGDDDDDEVSFPLTRNSSSGIKEESTPQKQQGEVLSGKAVKKKTIKKEHLTPTKEVTDDQSRTVPTKKKNRKRKRRKAMEDSSEDSGEPSAKMGTKDLEGFAVRCGNLPLGVTREDLCMFFGEADIIPLKILMKSKKKSGANEKKCFVKYATFICRTAEEAGQMCAMDGISMPSPAGHGEKRLIIHKMLSRRDKALIYEQKLYVGSLRATTKEELWEFFEKQQLHPTKVIVHCKDASKKYKGYGFVWLESADDVSKALELQKPAIGGRIFTIAKCKKQPFSNMKQ